MKALAKRPDDRFENADAFGSALADVLGAMPNLMPGASGKPAQSPQPGAPYLVMPPLPTPPGPAPKIPTPPWERASAPAPTPAEIAAPPAAPPPVVAPRAVVLAGAGPANPADVLAPFQCNNTPDSMTARLEALVSAKAMGTAPPPAPPPPAPPAIAPVSAQPHVVVVANPAVIPSPVLLTPPPPRPPGAPGTQSVSATPMPATPRHSARFDAEVQGYGTLPCQDISKGGMFLCTTDKLPPVFTRLKIKLPVAGNLEFIAEVVRHVTAEQARAWNGSPGFGVQFLELNLAQKEAVARMVQGLPALKATPAPARGEGDDRVATLALEKYAKRINGDHYVLLAVSNDAEFSEIKAHAREMKRELEELKTRPISAKQAEQIESALTRVQQAVDIIGVASKRIEFDANRGNYRGVARCIAAGLTVSEIDAARKRFLESHPGAETQGHVKFVTGNAYDNKGNSGLALENYESALHVDPLNLRIQQKYWALKRRAHEFKP
jgi:serine/threonine-protein kinase